MNYTRILIAVLIMAVVTYLPRMLPLAIFKKKIKSRFIRSFLAYVPYAVLAAMTFPEILYSTSNMLSAAAGLLVALILSYFGRGLLTVALSSTAAVFVVEQILTYMGK
ncbi:MAG: AzlD domain-containing protein [Clostridiales bacterium]|nr:AzlD domain-containing protein [Clostridiales bacterium]